ncbi:hypothetical protein [Tahibacter amnicola]|uniref:Uncharacterized protein n=1 Tax=Tahibacter amnicola TaxID=2976241 RepID=A0ABY6BE84_9GAMM|nr:hypothetical protein [Tahibacter amnicola]UXI67906.1 hypothetical protein N4264_24785 [Tahibacter amnicola]
MRILRTGLLILGFGGALLFLAALLVSYAAPLRIESAARGLIERELVARTQAAIDNAGQNKAVNAVMAWGQRIGAAAGVESTAVRDAVTRTVSDIVTRMQDPACPCRTRIVVAVESWGNGVLESAGAIKERVTQFVEAKYQQTVASLLREFRLFCTANGLVLLCLGLAVVIRRKADVQLLPVALMLTLAATITAYWYLFAQDWLHTIVFSDYVGLGYFAYLGLAFAGLCDIILNRARITVRVLNRILEMIGSAASSLAPC